MTNLAGFCLTQHPYFVLCNCALSRVDTAEPSFGVSHYYLLSPLCLSLCPGHTYAGGVFIAITHDYLIMRNKKGWFCLPEVKINRNFPVGYMNLIKYVRHTA